jgi:uncharacterized protein YggT (Ycf19 family)
MTTDEVARMLGWVWLFDVICVLLVIYIIIDWWRNWKG